MNEMLHLPFGLRFEEYPIAKDFVSPIYDENEDISVVIDENGQVIPFVEYYGNLGTKTVTKVQNEGTDEDPDSKMDGTRTLTEVREESSDSDDDRFSLILGTRTETFVRAEQSDEDPSIDVEPKPPLTTRTITSVVKEDTDKD